MAKARVNISDVSRFEKAVFSESNNINHLHFEFLNEIGRIEEQIYNEKNHISDVIEECSQGMLKANVKINQFETELRNLEAELAATPPTIIKETDDGDTVEEPNPRYAELISEISKIEAKIRRMNDINSSLEKLQGDAFDQKDKLMGAISDISRIKDKFNLHIPELLSISDEVIHKLKRIQDVLYEYTSVRIDSYVSYIKNN